MRAQMAGVALLCAACVVFAAEETPWYARKLTPEDKYVTDFVLKAGESREVQIKTDKRLRVSFMTDATAAQIDKFKAADEDNPILMKRAGGETYVASLLGAGAVYEPEHGSIHIVVTNGAKEASFKIVIVTREVK